MAAATDPYRVLGLPRTATLDEIKRAYRGLAKANHPDAAGPSALPRFLAIQAAYEQLVDGTGAARTRAGARPGGRPAPPPSRPSAPDPDRANATHRAYGGRSRRARPAPPGSAGPGAAGQGAAGAGAAPRGNPTGSTSGSPKRERGKATLGSTSYDDADTGPFEPDWGGASWYGTTSGTYWTINPKEYADPRKHGPEYQARARRATRQAVGDGDDPVREPGLDDPTDTTAGPTPGPTDTTAGPSAGPTHSTASWWDSTAGADARPSNDGEARTTTHEPPPRPPDRGRPADRPTEAPPPPDLATAATDLGRALTDERSARGRWRLVQAVVGWLPLALGLGWLVGEVSGCGRFAASCDGGIAMLGPILSVVALAVLLLVPRLAAIAASGAVAAAVAAVPTTVVLAATGSAAAPDARSGVLGLVLLVAWSSGIVIAVVRRLRASPTASRPDAPVS